MASISINKTLNLTESSSSATVDTGWVDATGISGNVLSFQCKASVVYSNINGTCNITYVKLDFAGNYSGAIGSATAQFIVTPMPETKKFSTTTKEFKRSSYNAEKLRGKEKSILNITALNGSKIDTGTGGASINASIKFSGINISLRPASGAMQSCEVNVYLNLICDRTGNVTITYKKDGAFWYDKSYTYGSTFYLPAIPSGSSDLKSDKYSVTFNPQGGTFKVTPKTEYTYTWTHIVSWGNWNNSLTPGTSQTADGIKSYNSNSSTKDENYNYSSLQCPTIEREGHDFQGWFTSPSGGNRVDNKNVLVNSNNNTYYAQWKTKQCDVVFDKNGLQSLSGTTKIKVDYNSQIGDNFPTPSPSTASINYPKVWNKKWYLKSSTSSPGGSSEATKDTTITNYNNSTTIYAGWLNVYKITFNLNGGQGDNGTVAKTEKVPINLWGAPYPTNYERENVKNVIKYEIDSNMLLESTTNQDATIYMPRSFVGWKSSIDQSIKGANDPYNVDKETIFTAQWKDGTLTTTISFTPPDVKDKPGYVFDAWNTQKDGNGSRYPAGLKQSNVVIKNSESLTLYPIFKPITNTIVRRWYSSETSTKYEQKNEPTYTIETKKFILSTPENSFTNDFTFLGWAKGDEKTGAAPAKWPGSNKGIYFNSSLAPSDTKVLTIDPSKKQAFEDWGKLDEKNPYKYDKKYLGLTDYYYGCWTVSGKYIKIKEGNDELVWKRITDVFIKNNGVWKLITDVYYKSNSGWKKEVGKK